MRSALVIALSAGLCLEAAAQCSTSGCELDDNTAPPFVFYFVTAEGQRLGGYDSTRDEAVILPAFLQSPAEDGSYFVEYPAADRREAYGMTQQVLSVQFADLRLPDKHPEGRAESIPIGESQAVVNWTGLATFVTVTGRLLDDELNLGCQWFCTLDIEYLGNLPDAKPSWAVLKSLYED